MILIDFLRYNIPNINYDKTQSICFLFGENTTCYQKHIGEILYFQYFVNIDKYAYKIGGKFNLIVYEVI